MKGFTALHMSCCNFFVCSCCIYTSLVYLVSADERKLSDRLVTVGWGVVGCVLAGSLWTGEQSRVAMQKRRWWAGRCAGELLWDRNPGLWHGTTKRWWKTNWSTYGKTGKCGAAHRDGGECLGEWRSLTCRVFLIQCLLTQLLPQGEDKANTHLVDVLSLI